MHAISSYKYSYAVAIVASSCGLAQVQTEKGGGINVYLACRGWENNESGRQTMKG